MKEMRSSLNEPIYTEKSRVRVSQDRDQAERTTQRVQTRKTTKKASVRTLRRQIMGHGGPIQTSGTCNSLQITYQPPSDRDTRGD